jgi:hypothetical protein
MITITKDKIYRSPFTLKKTSPDSDLVIEIEIADVIYMLGEEVELGEDVKFKNLFDLIIFNKDFFNILFSKEMRKILIEDFISDYENDFDTSLGNEDFKLRLAWQTEVFEYEKEIEYLDYVSFEAFGKLNVKTDEEDYPISIAFVSLAELKEKLVFIDNTFELHDDESYENEIGALFKANYRPLRLYDMFSSILREIAFYGNPEQRDIQRKELQKRAIEFEELINEEDFDAESNEFKNWNDISDEIDDMINQDFEKEDYHSFWDKIYPKSSPTGPSTQDKVDTAIVALSEGSNISLERQLQEAHDSEDYERAARLKRLIDKRDGKIK